MSEERAPQSTPPQALYVVREGVLSESAQNPDFVDLLLVVWREKWIVLFCTVAVAIASVVLALSLTEWYQSEVIIAPADARSAPTLGGQLGGLAALAGVRVGGEAVEAVATLRSRELARRLIAEYDLVPVLFSNQWDSVRDRWQGDDPDSWPDIRDAVEYFHREVRRVSVAQDTGLVSVSVRWTDAESAASWAAALVRLANDKLREQALLEAEANIEYLRSELENTSIVTLQQSLGRLLEVELQKLMLARGNDEFAFRIIDPAVTPKERHSPRRALIVVIGTLLGGLLGLFLVFIKSLWRRKIKE